MKISYYKADDSFVSNWKTKLLKIFKKRVRYPYFSLIIGGENGSKLSLRKGIKVKVHSTAKYLIFFQIGTTVISVILFPFLPRSCFVYAKIGPKPQLEDLIIELATP